MSERSKAIKTMLAMMLGVALRSPKKVFTRPVLAGILIALAVVVAFIFFAPDTNAAERRGYMQAHLDYPIDGEAQECEREGDQIASHLAAGGWLLIWDNCRLGGRQFHGSCAGNDDARGKSIDDTQAVGQCNAGRWFGRVAYGTEKEPYFDAGYRLYRGDQYNFDIYVSRKLNDNKVVAGVTWEF